VGELASPGIAGQCGDRSGTSAIELPLRVVRPEIGRRRHRPLTGVSGVVLFICMFLPAVEGCAHPIVPLDAPPLWVPYLHGFVFAVAPLARTALGLAAAAIALRVIAYLVIAGGATLLAVAPALGIAEIVVGIVLLAAIGVRGASEGRIAASAIALGGLATIWFAIWCASPGALVGVYLSLGSALGLFVGGLVWFAEVAITPRVRIPPAVRLR
jgi:hypothetical protein